MDFPPDDFLSPSSPKRAASKSDDRCTSRDLPPPDALRSKSKERAMSKDREGPPTPKDSCCDFFHFFWAALDDSACGSRNSNSLCLLRGGDEDDKTSLTGADIPRPFIGGLLDAASTFNGTIMGPWRALGSLEDVVGRSSGNPLGKLYSF